MKNFNTANLIKALDLESLAAADQEEILLTVGDLICKSSLVRLIERMDDAIREEFAKLLTEDAPEEKILAFFAEKVPTADEAVAEAIDELSDDILAVTN